MQWTPENRDCPVCKSSQRKTLGKRGGKSHRSNLGEEATVVRCGECSALYAYPTLLPVGNPYDESDFSDYFANHPEAGKVEAGENIAKEAESLLGSTGHVLEIGCGGGGMLQGFLNRDWTATGVEMTDAFADVAEKRGIRIIRQSVEGTDLSPEFDTIIFPAVLEHLYNPPEVLQKCVKALKPSGLVHIEVPNESALLLSFGNLFYKLKGRNWTTNLSPTFAPFHVVGFNPKSIKRLLKDAGLKLESLELTLYNTTLPNSSKLEKTIVSFVQKAGSIIGHADGISVWARKQ